MPITLQTFPAGPIETNAYLVLDGAGNAMIVDAPQDVAPAILAAAEAAGATIETIVITHPHWDHVGDAAALKEATGARLLAHPGARARLAHPGSVMFQLPQPIPPVTPDADLNEGDTVTLGDELFRVFFLPGHEPSHIVLYHEPSGTVLGGDVLFPRGHGRVDLPDADPRAMERSLMRLAALPDDTTVYPGHGAPTTIGAERDWLPHG